MVIVPERGELSALAETEKSTLPLPLPLFSEVMVIHEWLLTVSQPHPAWVIISIYPVPPLYDKDPLDGDVV